MFASLRRSLIHGRKRLDSTSVVCDLVACPTHNSCQQTRQSDCSFSNQLTAGNTLEGKSVIRDLAQPLWLLRARTSIIVTLCDLRLCVNWWLLVVCCLYQFVCVKVPVVLALYKFITFMIFHLLVCKWCANDLHYWCDGLCAIATCW